MPWYRTVHGVVTNELGDEPPKPSANRHEGSIWASPESVARFGKPTRSLGVYGEEPGAHCGACGVEEGMKHGK